MNIINRTFFFFSFLTELSGVIAVAVAMEVAVAVMTVSAALVISKLASPPGEDIHSLI